MNDETLRKTFFAIDIGYELICDTIGAINARAGKADGIVVFKLTLKPTGQNQRIDEEYLHSHTPSYVQVSEAQIIKGLRAYIKAHTDVNVMRIAIDSKGRILHFKVRSIETHNDHFMQLNIDGRV
jgi:hypothetical protein